MTSRNSRRSANIAEPSEVKFSIKNSAAYPAKYRLSRSVCTTRFRGGCFKGAGKRAKKTATRIRVPAIQLSIERCSKKRARNPASPASSRRNSNGNATQQTATVIARQATNRRNAKRPIFGYKRATAFKVSQPAHTCAASRNGRVQAQATV